MCITEEALHAPPDPDTHEMLEWGVSVTVYQCNVTQRPKFIQDLQFQRYCVHESEQGARQQSGRHGARAVA